MDEFLLLGLLLNRTATAMSSALNAALIEAGIDLPYSQFIVLRCLYYKGDMSQLDIARLLSKDAAAVKRTVDNLEKKGLVRRIPVRTLKNSVQITDEGKSIMPNAIAIAKAASRKATSGFRQKEIERLMKELELISENIRNNDL
ncbi:MAG: MarR family transcriptional regulator [Muribaculaceae bacterium]|nr:MarR family transcriptional regulator [Muribaculaceae bacterium]